jgi:hypothetical protein
VLVLAFERWSLLDVAIVDVSSSEADSGLGAGDRPGDIVMLTPQVVLLRAERYATGGRTYTLTVQIAGHGQLVVHKVPVRVP